jgi:hypothetical protein
MADVWRSRGKAHMATLDEIGQEKRRVSERLSRLDKERAQLADQLGELEIAERVLTQFGRRVVRTERRRREAWPQQRRPPVESGARGAAGKRVQWRCATPS